jgi:hypothetical protein
MSAIDRLSSDISLLEQVRRPTSLDLPRDGSRGEAASPARSPIRASIVKIARSLRPITGCSPAAPHPARGDTPEAERGPSLTTDTCARPRGAPHRSAPPPPTTTPTQLHPRRPASCSTPPPVRAACPLASACSPAATTRGEPNHERPKRTRHPYSRHFSHLDLLLSGDQHVGEDLGQAAQIMYPSSGPDHALCGHFLTRAP